MAKKKNSVKKPVSKRVKKTDAPKTRKPRATKVQQDGMEVTITEGPATQWVSGNADQFLDTSANAPVPVPPQSGSLFIANYPDQKVEFTKVNKNGWADAASEVYDDFISKMKKSDFTTQVRDFAFAHPLIFGIAFCTAVLIVVAAFGIASRIFGW